MDYNAFLELIQELSENASIDDTKKLAYLAYNLCVFVRAQHELLHDYSQIQKRLGQSWSKSIYAHNLSNSGFKYFTNESSELLDPEIEYFKKGFLEKKYKAIGYYMKSTSVDTKVKELYTSSMELVLEIIDISQNISIGLNSGISDDNKILLKTQSNLNEVISML